MENLICLKPTETKLNNLILNEPINIEILNKLINSKLLKETFHNPFVKYDNERLQLEKYRNKYKNGTIKVKYTRGGNINEFGRVNPEKALGGHSIRREIRHTLFRDYLMDIDIKNAHPTFLYQITKYLKLKNKYLERYINNRDEILNKIMELHKITRDNAKSLLIRLLYLGSYSEWKKENNINEEEHIEFLDKFSKEIWTLSKYIIEKNPELQNYLIQRNKTKTSSIISYYLQSIECLVLEELYNYCKNNNIIDKIGILSNDGLMIPKEKYNDDLLNKFSDLIKEKYELDIKFENKPLNQGYSLEEIEKNQLETTEIERFFKELDSLYNKDHFYYATLFKSLVEDKYIYHSKLGWYYYNTDNILIEIGSKAPPTLKNEITLTLREFLLEKSKLLNPSVHKDYLILQDIFFKAHSSIGKNDFQNGVIENLKGLFNDENLLEKIDNNENLICFKNMVYDFKINDFRKIEKSDYCCSNTGYNAPAVDIKYIQDELKEILKSIFEKEDMINFFLDSVGYSLKTNEFEKLYIWTGSGGNGKGLLSKLIEKAFGKYFYQGDNNFLTTTFKGGVGNSTLYNCNNKKFIMVSEPQNGDKSTDEVRFNTNFIKAITGRDTQTVRDIGGKNISFKPKFTTFIQCNEKPKIDSIDPAIRRRFLILNFPFEFVEGEPNLDKNQKKRDTTLKNKFDEELYYSQFIRLLFNHIKDKQNKLFIPDDVKFETNNYFENNNPVLEFINNEIEITNNKKDKIKPNDLFNYYISAGYEKITYKRFINDMKLNNFHIEKVSTSVYKNIRIKDKDDEDDINEF
jgi:P4 family phage/plasmid primase-like protien